MPSTISGTTSSGSACDGIATSSMVPGHQTVALGDGGPVDGDVAGADQVGGACAREPEQPGHRRVEPLARQAVGDHQRPVVDRGHDGRLPSSRRTLRNACRRISAAAMSMQTSATLNTGQCGTANRSTTCPRNGPGSRSMRSVRFPPIAGEQQAQGDGPDHVAEAAAEPQHHAHGRDGDQAEHDGELRAGAERGPGVAHQVETEPVAEEVDVGVGQALDGPDLGGDVDGVRRERDEDEDRAGGTAAGGCRTRRGGGLRAGPACIAGGQRRSSRCLHVMQSVARGKAIARILPMGLPHDSQMP